LASDSPLTERERLLAAELLAEADARAEKRIIAAVTAAMTNVTLQIGMAEKTTVAKIDGLRTSLRWQMVAALMCGQTLAAVAATYASGNGAKVEAVALAVVGLVS
jgi:hypothetical protein